MKLYTVLANVGGLIKMLWLIIFIIINPFIVLQYNKSLINEIFNFNDNEYFFKDKINSGIRHSRVNEAFLKLKSFVHVFRRDKKNQKTVKKTIASALNKVKIDSPTKQVIHDAFKIKETRLDLTVFENLMYYFCNYPNLRMKKDLIQRGSKAINKRIDITYIIQKIVEIEKLKVLLLDADQLKLFEYLPKPLLTTNKKEKLFSKRVFLNKVQANNKNMISLNYFHEKWKQLDEDPTKNNVLEKITSLYDSYQIIKSRELISDLDQKLLDMLDENIKNLLEMTAKSPKIKRLLTETNAKPKNFKMLLSLFTDYIKDENPIKNETTKYEREGERNSDYLEKSIDKRNKMKESNQSCNLNSKKSENCENLKNSSIELKVDEQEKKSINSKNEENKESEENESKKAIERVVVLSSKRVGDINKEVMRLNSKFKFLTKDDDSPENQG